MSEKNKGIIKKLILAGIIAFGLFTIIASGGGSSSVSNNGQTDTGTTDPESSPPTVSITSPSDGSTYNSGSFINFTGSAADYKGEAISGANLVWSSSINGRLGTGNIVELVRLLDGSHEITLRATDNYGNSASTKINISLQEEENTPPVVTISRPLDSSVYNSGELILFEGSALDSEDGYLTGESLKWFSTIDSEIGSGSTITKNNLSGGTHIITLIAEDSKGLKATAAPVTISIANTRPQAQITYPPDGTSYNQGDTITFNGEGTDSEDGDMYGQSLKWRSNIYGDFGQGRDLAVSFLPSGTHKISLTVTDKNGAVDTDDINITIN
ncbi:MAG: hypothetical protein H6680_05565 [Desulfobacteraceae bacterium]|nr:hypothetical protein [Desulfobacteraceae bacterium]